METQTSNQVTIHVDRNIMLPSNDQWENRFYIRSESSNRIYVVAQNKKSRFWGCSCPGWRSHRRCKHLESIGLPNYQRPFEAKIQGR